MNSFQKMHDAASTAFSFAETIRLRSDAPFDCVYERPLAERESVGLPVMYGCSYNKCTFCGAFRGQKFQVVPVDQTEMEIQARASSLSTPQINEATCFFLEGSDPFSLPAKYLFAVLSQFRKCFPAFTHCACHATIRSVIGKPKKDLKALYQAGLRRVYIGIESGNEPILRRTNKGSVRSDIIRALDLLAASGMQRNASVILGIGGQNLSVPHAIDTGTLITETQPERVHLRTLVPVENTPLAQEFGAGRFVLPEPHDIFRELGLMIRHITGRTNLISEHWTNFLTFTASLPDDRDRLTASLAQALRRPRGSFRPTGISSMAV